LLPPFSALPVTAGLRNIISDFETRLNLDRFAGDENRPADTDTMQTPRRDFAAETRVNLSSTPPPLGLTNAQFFEEDAGCPKRFLDSFLEFFRLLAQPPDSRDHVVVPFRVGRRFPRWSRHGRCDPASIAGVTRRA
jgi:hypothetical protein